MYPHNMQDVASDCGLTVLKSLLQYYKRYTESDFMTLVASKIFDQGLSLADITDILDAYGIHGDAYEVHDIDKIPFDMPVVVVTKTDIGNHYSIIYEERDGILTLSDPILASIVNVKKDALFKKFAGYVYVVENVDDRAKSRQKKRHSTLLQSNEKLDLLFFTTLQFVIPLFIFFSMQYLLIYKVDYIKIKDLVVIAFVYVCLLCSLAGAKYFGKKTALKIEHRGKERTMFNFMQKLDTLKNRREHNLYNDLMTFWTNFNGITKELIMYEIKIEIIYLSLFLLSILFFNVVMFLVVSIISVLLIACIISEIDGLRNYHKDFMNKMGKISVFIEEYMRNKSDRYIYADELAIHTHIQEALDAAEYARRKQQTKELKLFQLYDIIMYVIMLTIFCYMVIGFKVNTSIDLTSLMICFYIVYLLFNSLKPTLQKLINSTKYNMIADPLLIEMVRYRTDSVQPTSIYTQIHSVHVRNLSFAYEHTPKLLSHINADIIEGNIFLIDGDNGTGKTTLVNLILGLEQTYEGDIVFLDKDGGQITATPDFFAHNFSYYSTAQYLNYGSIRKNISYEIYTTRTSFALKNFFDVNLDKVVFYNGENISLGERQKILLSRCLNKDATVYIFDEPTTNLDTQSKTVFIQILIDLKKRNKLVIVITHDDDLKKLSDTILYLTKKEKGEPHE